jgi:GT2 family glycosyltransferase
VFCAAISLVQFSVQPDLRIRCQQSFVVSNKPLSVVVLGYRRFAETTGRCLASLAEDADFRSWDVILVDNGTDADDRACYVEAAGRYPTLKLLRLDQNAGFPGGMNAGLQIAEGDPIILVSSDVVIPAGMISRFATVLQNNPSAGLIAPVTNSAGNEQRIFIDPAADAMEQGRAFAEASPDGNVSAYRLDFCCVALRRAVYETIGGLDEAFSPGYYEDFDYSIRAKKAGFDLLVAENAFVYHEGGASFGRMSAEKNALIARNKRLFLDKHGEGTCLPHARETNLAVLVQYHDQVQAGRPPPAYRIANRLKLAAADVPKGIWKRWKYRRQAELLNQRLKAALADLGERRELETTS